MRDPFGFFASFRLSECVFARVHTDKKEALFIHVSTILLGPPVNSNAVYPFLNLFVIVSIKE